MCKSMKTTKLITDPELQATKQCMLKKLEELEGISHDLKELFTHFPEEYRAIDAYQLLEFVENYNPYSVSLGKIVRNLETEFEIEEEDETMSMEFTDILADNDPTEFDSAEEYVDHICDKVKEEFGRDIELEEYEQIENHYNFVHAYLNDEIEWN